MATINGSLSETAMFRVKKLLGGTLVTVHPKHLVLSHYLCDLVNQAEMTDYSTFE